MLLALGETQETAGGQGSKWGGVTGSYPPLILQARVLTPPSLPLPGDSSTEHAQKHTLYWGTHLRPWGRGRAPNPPVGLSSSAPPSCPGTRRQPHRSRSCELGCRGRIRSAGNGGAQTVPGAGVAGLWAPHSVWTLLWMLDGNARREDTFDLKVGKLRQPWLGGVGMSQLRAKWGC